MRKQEQRLWDRMRENLSKYPTISLERVENLVGNGTPDLHSICNGRAVWVELKAVDQDQLPKRVTTQVLGSKGLNVDQRNWHLNYHKHSGNSVIVVGVGLYVVLVEGLHADAINSATAVQLMNMASARSWPAIAKYLGAQE